MREWLHVTDHCSAIEHIINHGKIERTIISAQILVFQILN